VIKKYLQKIFKRVSYYLFLKIYGPITGSINSDSNNRIKVKIKNVKNNINYKVYIISNGRLYTDRLHDAAAIIDNKIIEGPSFQLRAGPEATIQFSKASNSIVFSKGTPRKLKKLNGTTLSLLTGGGGNNNYWHWLYDVLPKLSLCSNFVDLKKIDFFLFPNLERKFQNETLDFLGIPVHKRISSKKFRHIESKELIITDHPVVITGNATQDIQNIPKWIILWLKQNFIKKNLPTTSKKIFIDRNDDVSSSRSLRSISNEKEVKEYLLKSGFTIIKLHKIHFNEQVDLFYNAKCIVGLHGGGFANISFCKANTKIIELKSFSSGDAIKNLAIKNQLIYKAIISEYTEKPDFNFSTAQGSIHVPINKLIEVLES